MQCGKEKVVGILGGMGPAATVDLMKRVIDLTPAVDDADHIRMIVDNNPGVPSRMKALLDGTGESPGPCMAEMARRLASWGADFLVIPCNTAHFYYDDVRNAVSAPVVHLVDLTASVVAERLPEHMKAGIMASTAVVNTGLYDKAFMPYGVPLLYPCPADQERLLDVIRSVKAGDRGWDIRNSFLAIAASLVKEGAGILIIACTELGVIGEELGAEFVDTTDVLASHIVSVVKKGALPFEKMR
ncbi:amino acid racemase [Desulfobotulus sp. H1]|uniref:Amino acid racemase n=1 Tax=Desulfobotulus pelophilus TaxID=2823377 RepID=A0ABT3N5Y8_9BACT|nr:amino acid racemase [Desulfobotulus pelophilus]MCW7752874.1 amino acid racemase [Desulfobotulus pelophilus]